VAAQAEERVRAAGAIPATVGVLDGAVRVGLGAREIARLADAGASARKVGPRDLAACAVQRALGATTVGATLVACRAAGIRFLATGGIGGVHRGFPSPPDVSADLAQLARSQVAVVCAGAKSLLDVPATAEALETLGVPLLGWRTDTLPLFYSARGGPPVAARVESPEETARIARLHWRLGGGALLVARPPEPGLEDVEDLIRQAVAAAQRDGARGPALTPYALAFLHRESGGRTLAVNRELCWRTPRWRHGWRSRTGRSARIERPGLGASWPPRQVDMRGSTTRVRRRRSFRGMRVDSERWEATPAAPAVPMACWLHDGGGSANGIVRAGARTAGATGRAPPVRPRRPQ
jgi:pseudouridine-5'-phosphate glycosidase